MQMETFEVADIHDKNRRIAIEKDLFTSHDEHVAWAWFVDRLDEGWRIHVGTVRGFGSEVFEVAAATVKNKRIVALINPNGRVRGPFDSREHLLRWLRDYNFFPDIHERLDSLAYGNTKPMMEIMRKA